MKYSKYLHSACKSDYLKERGEILYKWVGGRCLVLLFFKRKPLSLKTNSAGKKPFNHSTFLGIYLEIWGPIFYPLAISLINGRPNAAFAWWLEESKQVCLSCLYGPIDLCITFSRKFLKLFFSVPLISSASEVYCSSWLWSTLTFR